MMKSKQITFFLFCFLIVMITAAPAYPADRVVVIPLIGNGTQLEPIKTADVLNRRGHFTYFSDEMSLFTVTNTSAYVITSILVLPEYYPATLQTIHLRYCSGSTCGFSWTVPNNTVTQLEFGPGFLVTTNASYTLDIPFRGGIPEGVATQIMVQVNGYRISK